MDEGGCRLPTSFGQNASGRRPGNLHHLSNFFVGKVFQVCKPQGLEFVQPQGNLLEQPHGNPGGLEMDHIGVMAHGAGFGRSGQVNPPG